MKRFLLVFFSAVFIFALAACGSDDTANDSGTDTEGTEEEVTIKVGATSVPHAEVLEEAKPLLAEEGINLEIEQYEEYVLPNDDLANGTIDANYYQHIPFLEQTVKDTGYDLTHIGGIHIEPMGAYSKGIKSIDEIEDGTEVILSNSVADHGRILNLFAQEGLITLDEEVDVDSAQIEDIVENPKNLKFSPDYDPAFLPEIYESEEDVLVVINTNFAIQAGLDPQTDALFIEGEDSPYVNVIAVREEDKDNETLNRLVEVLRSEPIQEFILEKYEGAVVPVSK